MSGRGRFALSLTSLACFIHTHWSACHIRDKLCVCVCVCVCVWVCFKFKLPDHLFVLPLPFSLPCSCLPVSGSVGVAAVSPAVERRTCRSFHSSSPATWPWSHLHSCARLFHQLHWLNQGPLTIVLALCFFLELFILGSMDIQVYFSLWAPALGCVFVSTSWQKTPMLLHPGFQSSIWAAPRRPCLLACLPADHPGSPHYAPLPRTIWVQINSVTPWLLPPLSLHLGLEKDLTQHNPSAIDCPAHRSNAVVSCKVPNENLNF